MHQGFFIHVGHLDRTSRLELHDEILSACTRRHKYDTFALAAVYRASVCMRVLDMEFSCGIHTSQVGRGTS